MAEKIIFHVDVNSAFLSWTAVDRLQKGETLDLRTIPSAIGGDVKSRRGVITAKSIPAKAYGVTTGEPVVSALKKCPELKLFPGDFVLYRKMSAAFMAICRELTPEVEPFSIDECFMDMTGILRHASRTEIVKAGDNLRDRIREELSFTVNVGISENKLLAKTASDFKKPDRTHTLFKDEIPAKFWSLPVRELLFAGKSSEARLASLGIRTIGELAHTPLSVLQAHFGEKSGAYLHRASNGIDDSPVQTAQEDAKSYGHSTTLAEDILRAEEAYPVLLSLSDKAAERMRRDHVRADTVTVTIRTNGFQNYSRQRRMPLHTAASDLIYEEAIRLFNALYDGKTPLRLLGVSLSGLIHDTDAEQMSFFGEEEREKKEKLGRMLDDINMRFGKHSVVRGTFYEAEKKNSDTGL